MDAPLGRYLDDHHLGSSAGVQMFRRATRRHPELADVTRQVEQDRASLLRVMAAVGARPSRGRGLLGRISGELSRLVLDRRANAQGPVADVRQLEALLLGLAGKSAAWRLLLELDDPRLDREQLRELLRRGDAQTAAVEQLRVRQGRASLGP